MGTGEYQTKSPVNATKSVNPGFVKNVYYYGLLLYTHTVCMSIMLIYVYHMSIKICLMFV